jgi:hypothetical protein
MLVGARLTSKWAHPDFLSAGLERCAEVRPWRDLVYLAFRPPHPFPLLLLVQVDIQVSETSLLYVMMHEYLCSVKLPRPGVAA